MTDLTSDFNLRSLVRETAEQWPLMAPGLLAKKVAERIPDEHLRDSVTQAMGLFVRQVLHEARPTPTGKNLASITKTSPAPPVTVKPASSGTNTSAPAQRATAGAPAPALPSGTSSAGDAPASRPRVISSRKGAEIRDGWQKHLDAEYPVKAGYKKLGDCTYEDLYFLAAQRDQQAENLKAHGRYFRGLAGLLVDHDVTTIRELPVETQMQAVGGR